MNPTIRKFDKQDLDRSWSTIGDIDRGYFVTTHSGGRFYLTDPRPEEVNIEDIAHALSHICRFTGHVQKFYSVAQHCVLAADCAPDEHKLAALLHDAGEAYTNDISSPMKWALNKLSGGALKSMEFAIATTIYRRFDVPTPLDPVVGEIDLRLLMTEARDLLPYDADIRGIENAPKPYTRPIAPWSSQTARRLFLEFFEALMADRAAARAVA